MAEGAGKTKPGKPLRRTPSQKRGLERVEQILAIARRLIAAHGSDYLRMSQISTAAGVSIGTVYQYFPDKAAVLLALAERYNAQGLACVRAALEGVRAQTDLHPALQQVVEGYYALVQSEPAMRDIWRASQGDPALRALEEADLEAHAALLGPALRRVWPDRAGGAKAERERRAIALLIMQLIAGAVRLAAGRPPEEGAVIIAAFKRLLPGRLIELLPPRRLRKVDKARAETPRLL